MQHVTPTTTATPTSTARVRVRQATTRDVNAVLALRLALLREYPNHPIYGRLRKDVSSRALSLFMAQLRSESEAIFLADAGGYASVGILRCVESIGSPLLDPARYAYVSSVYVKPEHRRRGVLRALLQAADRWSLDRDLDQMRLHNISDSVSAEGAWESLGFEIVEHVRVRNLRRR